LLFRVYVQGRGGNFIQPLLTDYRAIDLPGTLPCTSPFLLGLCRVERGFFVQKTSHYGSPASGDELHKSQLFQQVHDIHPISKSWSDILKSWALIDNKSFLFTIWVLVMLPVGVIHFMRTEDFRILMIVFGSVSLYCGIHIKDVISLCRNKNPVA
jgi:hypothetical protein